MRRQPPIRLGFCPAWALALAAGCATTKASAPPAVAATATPDSRSADGRVSPRAERIFSDANDLYAEQEKLGAVNAPELEHRYQQAADADPTFAEPLVNEGLLLVREGKGDQAAPIFTEALRRKPSLIRAAEGLAQVRAGQGQDAEASALLEGMAKQNPRDAEVRARLGELYLRQADSDRARTWSREALMRDPNSILAYRTLLEIAFRQGDDNLVQLLALKAQKAQPQDPLAAYYLGKVALRRKDLQKAVAQFRAAVALRSDFSPALDELAMLALANQDYASAETSLRKVLQSEPRACGAHLDLGVCERFLAKPDQAVAEYQEAVRCEPKLIQAYYDLGLFLDRVKNDCVGAIENYRKFISGNATPLPGDHPVFAALQDCQQKQATADQMPKGGAPVQPPASPPPAPAAAPPAVPTQDQPPLPTSADPAEPQN